MAYTLTTFDDSLRPRLAAGAVLSLLAHAGVLAVVFAVPGGMPHDLPRMLNPPATDPAQPPPTPLGIEQSNAVSINWLGFADPTEHHARPAEVEQAQLSPLDAGTPQPQPSQPVTAEAEPTPQPAPEADIALETTPAEAAPAEEVAQAPAAEEPAETDAQPAPSPLAVLEASSAAATHQLFRVVRHATARAQEIAELAARKAAEEAAEQAAEARRQAQAQNPTTPTPPAGDAPDANPSPKEADATSIDDVAEWVPGRPAAAQGLDITTVRPRWSITTRLSAVPRNPVVRIDFRKNGTVAKAVFLEGMDTGSRDVDAPLLDAIYNWTAKGKALDKLPAGDPKAVVSIKMQVILVPSRGTLRRANPDR